MVTALASSDAHLEWRVLGVEEALAGGGDEALGASIHAKCPPAGAEVASGVPLGAFEPTSDGGDGVATGEVVEDDPVPIAQHASGWRFETRRQGHSEVTRDGEGAGSDRGEDRPCRLDGDIVGDEGGRTGLYRRPKDGFVDGVGDDDSGYSTVGCWFGLADESDVGICLVVVGDEAGRDALERLGELLVGGDVGGE